ncbi:hypothetical protein ET495_08750 [Xylanimonas allomyrinae]|uniref:Uncharacterized protein n=1 Tax=Xylanimonas allomyrinae TaxID=2509459 RepID=A0A4P6EKZ6_9MICO|nr:hypothetical protein [Xylanimonas allomyrinae]QAY63322.1 hypothetical protein ET495_08750 [Xylanimonas allomyrinae]
MSVAKKRLRDGDLEFYFDSCHIDEVGIQWLAIRDVPRLVARVLRAQVGIDPGMRLAVAIPLEESVEPYCTPPSFDSLEADEFEPPSVYLFDARHFQLPNDDTERVRLRYSGNPWGADSESVSVELVSWRDSRGRSLDWPYSNTLWIWMGSKQKV